MPTNEDETADASTLIARVSAQGLPAFDSVSESVWVDVIHRMDEVYSELLSNEADLERKNAELEEAQAFISSVIASVSDILIVVNEKAVVRQVNTAFLKLVGRTEAEILGRKLELFILPEDRTRLTQLLASGREGVVQEDDLRFGTADGHEECLSIRCSAQLTTDRRRVGAVLSGRPISELRRAYQALHVAHTDLQRAQSRLIEQEKMASLGRLVAGVAHELNNPISFIYANIHALARYQKNLSVYLNAIHEDHDENDREALRRSLKIDAILADCQPLLDGTIEGADRVTDLVKNLRRLSFTKSSDRQPLNLSKVLHTAAALTIRSKRATANICFETDNDLFILANEGQLHQVFVNLIDNALYAVRDRADGRIGICVRRVGRTAEIVIEDNGIGIRAGDESKIFEPFFTTKQVGEGTGLGLWISFSIIKEYEGTISVVSQPNEGARFTIGFPCLP